jgi:hypothetical protein
MVMTRLHTRYDKSTLSDDLIFRIASPVAGGREVLVDSASGGIEQGSVPDEVNNFQARYAIRHPWTGPILCDHPDRGVWGGRPGDHAVEATMAAKDLAGAARGTVSLEALITSPVKDLGLHRFASPAGSAPGWRARYWRNVLLFTVLPLLLSVGALVVARRRRTVVKTA